MKLVFSKINFLSTAQPSLVKKVPKSHLDKMDGREVVEKSNGLCIRAVRRGLMDPFWLLVKNKWLEEVAE